MNEQTEHKCRSECLKNFSTADLVFELETRIGDNVTTVLTGWEYSLEKLPPEENDENAYDYFDFDSDNPGMWSGLSGVGPCKILVVVD